MIDSADRKRTLRRVAILRFAVQHLLDGLDPALAQDDAGLEILEGRMEDFPENAKTALRIAKEVAPPS